MNGLRNSGFVFLFLLLVSLPTWAKTSMNSMCYLQSTSGATIQGEHNQELFEIASVSKVFTTFWALQELGAQFRFATGVHVTPIAPGQVDVHLEGARDPFWGRQLTHLLVSELYRLGVREIRHLTFDENFKLRWSVVTSFEKPLDPLPAEIEVGLLSHMKALPKEYPQTVQEAAKSGITLSAAEQMKVQFVSYVPKKDFKKQPTTNSMSLKSAPLFRYLKEMNVVSNNHVADKLYENLGGTDAFKAFFKKSLGLDGDQLRFINGSGNSVVIGNDPSGRPIKQYNKATCDTLIRVVVALQNELVNKQGLDLTAVLAVSKSDQGTMSPRYDGIPNTAIAKTGTVDPAVTMTGVLSTAAGNIFFGVLLKTDSVADWEEARDQVRTRVYELIAKFGGARPVAYSPSLFLPFDGKSVLSGTSQGFSKP
jgi:D-alanyl-D-alanine carboxypeptidase